MPGEARTQRYLQTNYKHRRTARYASLALSLVFGTYALWAWQYSASAILRVTWSGREEDRISAPDAVRSALNDERLVAIIKQVQLYPQMLRTGGEASAIRYMRARVFLQSVGHGKSNAEVVSVTYRSWKIATAIKVTNALALSLTAVEPSAVDLLSATTERELEDSRSKLKQFAADVQEPAKDGKLRAALSRTLLTEDKNQPSAPEQQGGQTSGQWNVGSVAAPASVALPETPAAKAIQQQIKDAEARLMELRQRYTEQYPDVQDTQEELQELRSKLNRMLVQGPRSEQETLLNRDDRRIAQEEELARAEQTHAQIAATIEMNREKSLKASTVPRAYAIELDRYLALLRAQRTIKDYRDESRDSPKPKFTVIQNANRAKATGIALAGLIWATLLILFERRLKTPPWEQIAQEPRRAGTNSRLRVAPLRR